MSTQPDPRTDILVANLLASGVPRFEAIAIATSIEHALTSPCYAAQFGSIAVEALNTFLDRLST